MNNNLEAIKAILLKNLKQFNLNDAIDTQWLRQIIEFHLDKPIPEELIVSYLTDKGFNNITSSHELDINKTEPHRVYENDKNEVQIEELEDFDPNLFLKENRAEIESKIISNFIFEENINLIKSYHENRNEAILFEIINKNKGLIEKVAFNFANNSKHKLEFEDLVSVGKFGLFKAIERFKPELGYQFSTYAIHWIRQTISRAIMDEGTTIRVPVHVHEQLVKVLKKENECVKLHDYLDIYWVCRELNITMEKYHYLKRIDHSYLRLASLHSIVSNEGEDSHLIDFIEYLPDHLIGGEIPEFISPDEQMIILDRNEKLKNILNILTDREKEVLKLRFGFYNNKIYTLEEIGDIYNVTRERIRQIEAKSLAKIRAKLQYEKLDYLDLVP